MPLQYFLFGKKSKDFAEDFATIIENWTQFAFFPDL